MNNSPTDLRQADLWEQSEIRCSASEAKKTKLDMVDAEPYLNPPAGTPYPLRYAYHLLGDARDKVVLDFGCGSGKNTVILARRSKRVIGVDISPDLIELARERLRMSGTQAELRTASCYDTGLEAASVDIIFAMVILHHMDLGRAKQEMNRILRPGGSIILREPVRDSRTVALLRKLVPFSAQDVSDFERPLSRDELEFFAEGFKRIANRRFRLPLLKFSWLLPPELRRAAWNCDAWFLRKFRFLNRYATTEVMQLVKDKS